MTRLWLISFRVVVRRTRYGADVTVEERTFPSQQLFVRPLEQTADEVRQEAAAHLCASYDLTGFQGQQLSATIEIVACEPVLTLAGLASSLLTVDGNRPTDEQLPTAVMIEVGYEDYGPSQQTASNQPELLVLPCASAAYAAAARLRENETNWRVAFYVTRASVDRGFSSVDEAVEAGKSAVSNILKEDE